MNTTGLLLSSLLPIAAILGSTSAAQNVRNTSASVSSVTTDSITIGGVGSLSSAGSSNPGMLDDGITVASATYVFTLDTGANTLKLVVTNTSPVLVGVPNPLLTDIFFNTPSQVTAVILASQTSSAGVAPSYALVFDADRATAPNPNGADGFGAFSVAISDTGNIAGTIANPNADTYTMPAASLAISPCTFNMNLTGTLTGLTADDFTALLSRIPPGTPASHAVGKFQAGGVASGSAFINQGEPCTGAATSGALGSPCGGTLTVSPARARRLDRDHNGRFSRSRRHPHVQAERAGRPSRSRAARCSCRRRPRWGWCSRPTRTATSRSATSSPRPTTPAVSSSSCRRWCSTPTTRITPWRSRTACW
jgi:hypothetical protein